MNRRLLTGVVAGVLAAAVLLTVGFGAYQAGRDDQVVTQVVDEGDPEQATEVVRVVDDDHFGPRPGFFLFPLFILLIVVLLWRPWGRWRHHRWHGPPHGPPYGPHGQYYGPPGSGEGYGPPPGERAAWLDDWHRRAHQMEPEDAPADEPPPPGGPSQAPSSDEA